MASTGTKHRSYRARLFLPGIYSVALADHGVSLEIDATYRWYVSVLKGAAPGSGDQVAGGSVMRVATSPELDAELDDAGIADAVLVHARRGFWYDALREVVAVEPALARDPANLALERRIALFEQAGLDAAAAFERKRARR